MNKELLRMQKLAGLITESELREKLSLNENKTLDPLVTSDKVNPGETIARALSSRDSVNIKSMSPEYLAKIYNHEPFKKLSAEKYTPKNIQSILDKLPKKELSKEDGDKLVSDISLGKGYTLITFNNKKYLSSDGGRYITAIK